MGERHQAFLIARVRPHGAQAGDPGQRRCIAGFHHQWCCGILPLLAMRRLITLVSHPENAAVVRAELRTIDGQYGYGYEEPEIPDIPCPYTASLLGSAWTTDLEAGQTVYASGWTLENAVLRVWLGCWDEDNNDGISILDITEHDRPAYCFLQAEDVLDAYEYLSTYYSIGKYQPSPTVGSSSKRDEGVDEADTETESDEEDQYSRPSDRLSRAIEGLKDVPVISADLLREAWPHVRFRDLRRSPASSTTMTEVVAADVSSAVPSLVALTFDAAVKHSLDTADTRDLERLIWLPGKAERSRRFSATLLRSLILAPNYSVDLSDFQLSGFQLLEVLSGCGEIAFLDASFNSVLVAEDIPKVLDAAPTLRRLVIIGCSSITDAHVLALVQNEPSRFKSLEGLVHPAFLTVEKPDPYPTAFTFVNGIDNRNLACASIPFFTPAQVIQALIDVLPWNAQEGGSSYPMMGFSTFHAGVRAQDEKFGQRPVVSVPFLTPMIPRGQKDFWAFIVSRASPPFSKNQKNMWGFVHFTSEDESGTSDAVPETESPVTGWREPVRKLGCTGQLYDVRGFLECMASDGRPMPSEAAVKELE
ncbi:hypothetical protein LXA43DRAFT_1185915, partial [Ganoderma leucocontextum]